MTSKRNDIKKEEWKIFWLGFAFGIIAGVMLIVIINRAIQMI